MNKEQIIEKMNQRTRQILVHSCIYYEFDRNIVPDYKYDQWGNELIELVRDNPDVLDQIEYGYMFKNYTEASSGFNLNYRHPNILNKARYLINLHDKKTVKR